MAFRGPCSLGGEIGHSKALQTSQERDSNPNLHACCNLNRIASVTPDMPGPEQLKPKALVVGGRYLHANGLFIRQIDAIEGDTVTLRTSD